MQIEPGRVVTLEWTLRDAQGNVLGASDAPQDFLVGSGDLLPVVERALAAQGAGHEARLRIEPEEAFGEYDAGLVCFENRALFPQVEAGMQVEGLPEGARSSGMPRDALYTVTEVYDEHVVLDANHPLAGIGLDLTLKVAAVREATDAERERGSAGTPWLGLASSRPDDAPLH